MVSVKNLNNNSKITRIGLFLAFFSLLIYGIFLFVSYKIRSEELGLKNSGNQIVSGPSQKPDPSESQWEKYTDSVLGFSIMYPGLLIKRVRNNEGEYLTFVRFEENQFSEGTFQKGVAVGVTDRGTAAEVEKIKREMQELGGDPAIEEEVTLGGRRAVHLLFNPIDPTIAEKRSFAIFSLGGKTFSVSTVPDQLERVLSSIESY